MSTPIPHNILITGLPKSGKTTLLRALIAPLPHKVGFVTNEVRNEHGRIGFDFETHIGLKAPLARVETQKQELLAALKADGMATVGEPQYAGYNAPWTPPWMARHEVMVEVK